MNHIQFHKSNLIRGLAEQESVWQYIIRKVARYVELRRGGHCYNTMALKNPSGRDDLRVIYHQDECPRLRTATGKLQDGTQYWALSDASENITTIYRDSRDICTIFTVYDHDVQQWMARDPSHDKILEYLPLAILTMDVISPRYKIFRHDLLGPNLASGNARGGEGGSITFFPDNYPVGGIPIILSQASILPFCDGQFLQPRCESTPEYHEISSSHYTLDEITEVSEDVATMVELTLAYPPETLQYHKMRIHLDQMSIDDVATSVRILRYLGVSWKVVIP